MYVNFASVPRWHSSIDSCRPGKGLCLLQKTVCPNECEEKVVRVKILFLDLLLVHPTLANHLCIQAADVFIISPCTMKRDLYL